MAQPTTDAAIEVTNLVKRYAKAPVNAVDGVTFTVRRGEIFGLLGPNCAGKTTTIGILTTSVVPTDGKAYIMGHDVTADPIGTKQRIAIVPQQSNLDRSLRAKEILTFHAAYHGVPRREREARATALLAEMGLAERAKERLTRYSGGMAQRLMIARALMHFPELLFLDEPTNNLDPQSRLFLWDRIQQMNSQGLTILLTTHDMAEADQLCQRIAIMDHGKVLALDTSDELKKRIPGGTSLDLRVALAQPATVGTSNGASPESPMLRALRALPGADKVDEIAPDTGDPMQEGITRYRLYGADAGALTAPALATLAANGGELRDLHLARPSLEDVFIYLTGRNLR